MCGGNLSRFVGGCPGLATIVTLFSGYGLTFMQRCFMCVAGVLLRSCWLVSSFMLRCFRTTHFALCIFFTTIGTIGTIGKHNRIPRNFFRYGTLFEFQDIFLRHRCDLPATILRCCFCYSSVLDSIDFLCV